MSAWSEWGWYVSPEQNKELFYRFVRDILNQENPQAADSLLGDLTSIVHLPPSPPIHQDGVRMYQAAFGDLHAEVQTITASADSVQAVLTIRGRHKGNIVGIPATGKQVVFQTFDTIRIARGRIVEHTTIPDLPGLRRQLAGDQENVPS